MDLNLEHFISECVCVFVRVCVSVRSSHPVYFEPVLWFVVLYVQTVIISVCITHDTDVHNCDNSAILLLHCDAFILKCFLNVWFVVNLKIWVFTFCFV